MLVLLSPVMVLVAIAVRISMGKPVLFRQRRPGLNEEPFMLLKFRSMRDACDAQGRPHSDEERTTWLGNLLRKTSLDELPQLWNVLRGDMSLIGPRPLLMEYLGRYPQRYRRRHAVRPGITGLAQISGRKALKFSERFDLDVWYVEHWSLVLDLKIVLRTIGQVLSSKDTVPEGDWQDLDDLGIFPEEWKEPVEPVTGEVLWESEIPGEQAGSIQHSAAGRSHGNEYTP